jgi:hypothetical protein
VHEQELLAIVTALKKWRFHLLGTHFEVYTDHRTLEFFETQRDLSRRQLRWAEALSQYDFDLHYVKGEDNTVADGLSRYPDAVPDVLASAWCLSHIRRVTANSPDVVAATMEIAPDPDLLRSIKEGYEKDEFCVKLLKNVGSVDGARAEGGLLYVGSRLVIPRHGKIRELLFHLAHDSLGHFGPGKSYEALRGSYYWPGMRTELQELYVPSCPDCQRNKSPTTKPTGPLHPLPIPDKRFDSVAIDFIGPLPLDNGCDSIITFTDRLGGADIRIIASRTDITAPELATLFFDHWYCENGLPLDIISDRDKLFISQFWKALHKLTGVKIKMSTAYHPETDGASERTNKTVNQMLRFHVDRHQKDWVRALPRIRFCIMNTINASTGYTPFHLKSGHSPRILPPLVPSPGDASDSDTVTAMELVTQLQQDVMDAQDNLLAAKTRQAHYANQHRGDEDVFQVGDLVMLSTKNRRSEYKKKGKKRAAKFMPRFDGPYAVTKAFPEKSEYELLIPNARRGTFLGYHSSLLRRYHPNDPLLFPDREPARPGPVVIHDGDEEYIVECILDEQKVGRGKQYLVRFQGWGPEEDRWLPGREVADLQALDDWEISQAGV